MDTINKQALKELMEYRADGCHMLVPCMDQIADVADGFRLIVTKTFLRPHPKDKDVYPHESGTYEKNDWKCHPDHVGAQLVRISGQGLEKLAQNVKIEWSKPIISTDPSTSDDDLRQLCEIEGALRMPDGFSFYRVPDAYGMDLNFEMDKIIANYSYNGKFDEKKQWMVDRDFLAKKGNQTKLCISGAKNRVIRKLLGIDTAYTVASLAKPFVAVRVIPWLDMSDPYTRQLVIQMNVKQMAIASLFGGQVPEQRQLPPPEEASPVSYRTPIPPEKCKGEEDPNVIDAETTNGKGKTYHLDGKNDSPAPGDDVPFGLDSEPTPTTAESLRADFENCDTDGQCKALTVLIHQKGKAEYFKVWLAKLKAPHNTMETISAKKRLEIYDVLVAIPDAGKAAA